MDTDKRYAYNLESEAMCSFFIAKTAEVTGCELYLELGLMVGGTMREVSKYSRRSIGVDIADCPLDGFEFHKKTTDEFFKTFDERPNIIFIDADHHFEQVKVDFKNSLKCLSEHGIIFLHDTDPWHAELLSQSRCGDAYRMHDWIKQNYPCLGLITLPITLAGLTIVNRDMDRRVLKILN